MRLRKLVMDLAAKNGLAIAAAGSHPFSAWQTQEITPLERYIGVREDLQDLAQRLLIFGTHVHIGIEDREFLIDAMNVSRYFLPHVLALSTSSPFWLGPPDRAQEYRSVVFRNFPRTGVPPELRVVEPSTSDWSTTLVATNSIPNSSKIWWDVRPNWTYPDPRVPDLRRLHPGRGGGLHRRHLPGHHRQALEAAARQPDLPASTRRS